MSWARYPSLLFSGFFAIFGMTVVCLGKDWKEGGRQEGRKDGKEDGVVEGREGGSEEGRSAMRLYIQLVFLVMKDKCTISSHKHTPKLRGL